MPQWVKGQSGNPKGRPRLEHTFTDVVKRMMRERDENGIPRHDKVTDVLFNLAMSGDLPSIKYLMDRVDGAPGPAEAENNEATKKEIEMKRVGARAPEES